MAHPAPGVGRRSGNRTLTLDKKAANQEARFVLIDRIGHAAPFGGAYCKAVSKKELDALTDWLEHNGKRTD